MDEQLKTNLGYHYTSVHTLLKILDSADGENLKFHASSVFSLNDPSEMKCGYEEIMRILPEIEEELHIEEPIYMLSKLWEKSPQFTKEWWNNFHLEQMNNTFNHSFAISYSRCRDELPMWGMYGDNGGGVALGFDIRIYCAERKTDYGGRLLDITHVDFDKLHSVDVVYDTLKKADMAYSWAIFQYRNYWQSIKSAIDKDEIVKKQLEAITSIMECAAPFVKHKAYSYEKESRIVVPRIPLSAIKIKTNSKGELIPYVEVDIPTNTLKEIIIGPCNDFSLIKKCIELKLLQKGIDGVEISNSDVPYIN